MKRYVYFTFIALFFCPSMSAMDNIVNLNDPNLGEYQTKDYLFKKQGVLQVLLEWQQSVKELNQKARQLIKLYNNKNINFIKYKNQKMQFKQQKTTLRTSAEQRIVQISGRAGASLEGVDIVNFDQKDIDELADSFMPNVNL